MWGFWFLTVEHLKSINHVCQQGKPDLRKVDLFRSVSLTVFAPSVEVLDVVIEADSDGGEAHLSLQPRHQPVVQRPGSLCFDHGADRPEHASVADASHRRLLSLNLGSQIVLEAKTSFYRSRSRKHAAYSNRSVIECDWFFGMMKWTKSSCSVNSAFQSVQN